MRTGTELANGRIQPSSLCACYSTGASREVWIPICRTSWRLSWFVCWDRVGRQWASLVLINAPQSTPNARRRAILLGRRLWSLSGSSIWLVCEDRVARRVLAGWNISR